MTTNHVFLENFQQWSTMWLIWTSWIGRRVWIQVWVQVFTMFYSYLYTSPEINCHLHTGQDLQILNLLLAMFWFAVHGRSTPHFSKQILEVNLEDDNKHVLIKCGVDLLSQKVIKGSGFWGSAQCSWKELADL